KTAYEMIWRLEFRRVLFRSRKLCSLASFCGDYLSHIPTGDALPVSRLVRGGDNHLVFGPICRPSRSDSSHWTRWRCWPIRGRGQIGRASCSEVVDIVVVAGA